MSSLKNESDKVLTSDIISGVKLAGWSMTRRLACAAPDMTIQANRFTSSGYFKPLDL